MASLSDDPSLIMGAFVANGGSLSDYLTDMTKEQAAASCL
ncbi:hypothetical protein Dip510_001375 [Elusimicrobium posterum]